MEGHANHLRVFQKFTVLKRRILILVWFQRPLTPVLTRMGLPKLSSRVTVVGSLTEVITRGDSTDA